MKRYHPDGARYFIQLAKRAVHRNKVYYFNITAMGMYMLVAGFHGINVSVI